MIYGTVLALAALGLYVAILWLRRKFGRPTDTSSGAGFSIDELEAMHKSGQISDAEFRRLRSRALKLAGGSGQQQESELSEPPASDDERS